MLTAQEFIKTHKMEYTSIDIAEQMEAYLDEMKKGLCGEESSLYLAEKRSKTRKALNLRGCGRDKPADHGRKIFTGRKLSYGRDQPVYDAGCGKGSRSGRIF